MPEDPARRYVLSRAVYRLTARVFELVRSSDFALRSDLMTVVREAITAGRWYEQASRADAERMPGPRETPLPKVIVADDLYDDDDLITLPQRPR